MFLFLCCIPAETGRDCQIHSPFVGTKPGEIILKRIVHSDIEPPPPQPNPELLWDQTVRIDSSLLVWYARNIVHLLACSWATFLPNCTWPSFNPTSYLDTGRIERRHYSTSYHPIPFSFHSRGPRPLRFSVVSNLTFPAFQVPTHILKLPPTSRHMLPCRLILSSRICSKGKRKRYMISMQRIMFMRKTVPRKGARKRKKDHSNCQH